MIHTLIIRDSDQAFKGTPPSLDTGWDFLLAEGIRSPRRGKNNETEKPREVHLVARGISESYASFPLGENGLEDNEVTLRQRRRIRNGTIPIN